MMKMVGGMGRQACTISKRKCTQIPHPHLAVCAPFTPPRTVESNQSGLDRWRDANLEEGRK